MAMSEMAAMREIHPKDLIAVLKRGQQHRHVRLRTGMRLHISVFGSEKLFCTIYRCLLDNVGKFTPAVISLARVTFGVLVGKDRAHRLQYRFGNKILRRDQFKAIRLPPHLIVDRIADKGVGLENIRRKKAVHISQFGLF
jgi:hypothetical protein